jgi:signal transduction histidine kinase
MPKNVSKGTPDRARTDESLLSERKKADRAIAERMNVLEADADRVVDRARSQADAVLDAAREKADDKLDTAISGSALRAVLEEERNAEDQTLEQERATADQTLLEEREANARTLLALLPLERSSTDRSLLTERVRSDDAVSNRDDFLGMVSHDLRDLLGGIVTSSALILRTAATGDDGRPTRAAAERIQRYAARMKRLIEDLTDLVSIDAGRLAVSLVYGNAAPVISEAVGSLRGAAAAKNVALEFDDGVTLPARFDVERLLQVLTNLLANAIRFTPEGGKIRVESVLSAEIVQLSVTDTGPGIAPEFIEAIFERFRQLPNSERRGLGLGLYISRCLIEAQHGKIWAESIPGRGTTIVLTLPCR